MVNTEDASKIALARSRMRGTALSWYRVYALRRGTTSWTKFLTALINEFEPPSNKKRLKRELDKIKQEGEVTAYADAF